MFISLGEEFKSRDYESMKVLGINPAFDSSAALFIDGKVLFAVAEERISRIKHHAHSFSSCVPHVLGLASLSIEDLDGVVICRHGLSESLADSDNRILLDSLRTSAKSFEIVESHHYLHACSSFFASGYSSSAILVMDGLGTHVNYVRPNYSGVEENPEIFQDRFLGSVYESTSIWVGSGRSVTPVRMRYSTHNTNISESEDISIGRLYSYASRHLFKSRFDAGKVMALAAYGKPISIQFLSVNHEQLRICEEAIDLFAKMKGGTGYSPEDLAASVQQAVEFAVPFRANQARRLTDKMALCLAGGVFLNCITNSRIREQGIFPNIFCPSAPSDDGIAIGAALHGAYVSGNYPIELTNYSPYLGSPTDLTSLPEIALKFDLFARNLAWEHLYATAAGILWNEGVILWHQGQSEFGPRALGNRSILANPFIAGIRDHINQKIKSREYFRPVAPVLLSSSLERYFTEFPSRLTELMLESCRVRPEYSELLKETLHVDGSARIQTVPDNSPLPIAKLLKAFYSLSGHPILINTSLNGKDEPICESLIDSLRFFVRSPVKHAVIGNCLIVKKV